MEKLQLTPVSGLSIPVQLSNYKAEGRVLFCDEELGTHYTKVELTNGDIAFCQVEDNETDIEDQNWIANDSVEIVEQEC